MVINLLLLMAGRVPALPDQADGPCHPRHPTPRRAAVIFYGGSLLVNLLVRTPAHLLDHVTQRPPQAQVSDRLQSNAILTADTVRYGFPVGVIRAR